ncbi:hypothetical protein [Oscillatoria salina]|nr:hypothetical protein [Oscillatoria salina]MBZ8180973.1 hypothetical protein [Oscillatoria salina IIICB1]
MTLKVKVVNQLIDNNLISQMSCPVELADGEASPLALTDPLLPSQR